MIDMNEKVLTSVDKKQWRTSPLLGQIVLVSTMNGNATPNVAPKSWVSMASLRPPMLGFGCNVTHQTARNILERREFVVNIPGSDLTKTEWSIGESPHNSVDRLKNLGLTLIPSVAVSPPRILQCKAHIECLYDSDKRYGAEVWIFGKIIRVTVDQRILQGSRPERYRSLNPCFYLEEKTYGTLGEIRVIRST